MPDQPMLEVLAATGAATVVATMATDAWQAVRTGTASLFHRHDRAGNAAVEAQLDSDASLVTRGGDVGETRRILADAWRLRLAALLQEHPEAAADLDALIDAVRSEASPGRVQHNHATAGGVVYAVQDGNQTITNNPSAATSAERQG